MKGGRELNGKLAISRKRWKIGPGLVAWYSGNAFDPVSEVTVRRVRLVLRWVTACGPCNLVIVICNRYVTSRLGQLSLSFFRGRYIEYRPIWLGLRRVAFTSVGWQITLCDPIWQVTPRSSEMGSLIRSYMRPFFFNVNKLLHFSRNNNYVRYNYS